MKKVFKDYLEIYVGSRGLIEDVSIKSFEDIKVNSKKKVMKIVNGLKKMMKWMKIIRMNY